MFAVPGWNVAAKSLVQEQVKPVKERSKNTLAGSSTQLDSANVSTKRKRGERTKTQGPDSTSKPQGRPSIDSNVPPSSKKRKTQHNDAQPRSCGSKQNGKSNKQRGSRHHKTTGANTEPVRPKAAKADIDTVVPQRKPCKATEKNNSVEGTGIGTHPKKALRDTDEPVNSSVQPALPPIPPVPSTLTPLQAKMRAKLTSARFRHLNETLYTTSSFDALNLFTNSPDLFAEYHAGFSQQVKDSWPQNPVEVYVKTMKLRGSLNSPVHASAALPPLPRRKPGLCTIADLGCGDAPLGRGLQSAIKKLGLKLYNFDLHAPNSLVTKADISALPLRDGEVDIAIFCLSLMGTNWLGFVEEAWRVLRGDGKGEVWVAEVKSRFGRLSARKGVGKVVENSVGKRRKPQAGKTNRPEYDADTQKPALVEDEREAEMPGANDDTDLQPFIDSFQRRGFMLREGSVEKSNKMFVSMVFTKAGVPRAGKWKGMKWNGKEYHQTAGRSKGPQKRFHGNHIDDDDEEVDEDTEGQLLKPCVYKLR